MMLASLAMIAFLILMVLGIVLGDLWRGLLVRGSGAPQDQDDFPDQGLRFLSRAGFAVIVESRVENDLVPAGPVDRRDRARLYLRRIAALTGATETENGYALDAGTTRFCVRDRYVRRIRDAADPECAWDETCFYLAHKDIPKAEQIATALLQLRNNPALFDKWSAQNGLAFKPDGQVLTRR